MAVITIKKNGVFDDKQTDELNKAFFIINSGIDNYESKSLDYKFDIQNVANSSHSFRRGNVLCLREALSIDKVYTEFGVIQILPLSCSIPYDVWGLATTKENEHMIYHIKGTDLSVYGTLAKYPTTVYICLDLVIPK